jgi:hypothetical protein
LRVSEDLVGDLKNGGREWRPKGSPEEFRVHNGLCDIAGNAG